MAESWWRKKGTHFRPAAKQVKRTKHASKKEKNETASPPATLPQDEENKYRVVCRRYAEKRATGIDSEGRPECFESEHPDCESCRRDITEGIIETW